MDWILKALGAGVDHVDAVTDWSLRWQGGNRVWLAAVLVGVLVFLAWWSYRKSPQELTSGRRCLLSLLRTALVVVLAGILLQPVLVLTLEREIKRTLPLLVDGTGSMGITDGGEVSRMERVGEWFGSVPGQQLVASLEDDLAVPVFAFSRGEPQEMAGEWSTLEPEGESTALGDRLVQTLERYRGGSLAGIVLITDGGQNAGLPLARAEVLLKQAGVPVYAVGVGDAGARDVAVESVELQDAVLADDAAPVTVRLRSQGMKGGRGKLVVALDGVQVAEEEVQFEEDGPLEVRALFIPKRAGVYPLKVRFEVAGAEDALSENNSGRTTLRVVEKRLRVLLIDQAPRWEYKYLEAMLLRERRVDLSCYLFEADREVARVAGSPYVEQFPMRAEDLFEFDLVILGDIDPQLLTEQHQALLRNYVAQAGGALVVVAGKRFLPHRYQRTELARLLPVELAGASIGAADAVASRPLRLALTEGGRASVMMRLGDDAESSEALWRTLPAIYWAARVTRAKPAAEVLLSRPDPNRESESLPVIALHRYGAGEVLFVGTDNFWRWRRNAGERYHATLWGQIIQRMAGSRLLTESPRVTLRSDRRRYRRGDRVRVYARLFASNWEPWREEVVSGVLISSEDPDRRREVALQALPGQPGLYRAEFSAGEAGNYRLALSGDEVATLDFMVRADDREFSRAAMNSGLLRDLAMQTGGAYVDLKDIDQLPAAITNRTARRTSLAEVDLWASPVIFALVVLLLTAEWIIRKYSELK